MSYVTVSHLLCGNAEKDISEESETKEQPLVTDFYRQVLDSIFSSVYQESLISIMRMWRRWNCPVGTSQSLILQLLFVESIHLLVSSLSRKIVGKRRLFFNSFYLFKSL